jgi:hypothetical protein
MPEGSTVEGSGRFRGSEVNLKSCRKVCAVRIGRCRVANMVLEIGVSSSNPSGRDLSK